MTKSERFKVNARLMQKFNCMKNSEKTIVSIAEFGTWSIFSCVADSNANVVIRVTLNEGKEAASVDLFNGNTVDVEAMDDVTIEKYTSIIDSILDTVN